METKKRTLFTPMSPAERIKTIVTYLLAFVLPIIVMGIIYKSRGIYPFGEEMYLRSDMYHQYAPFHRELARKLAEGASMTYSWNIGMGVNFSALAAYYLASPFNWILKFYNSNHVIEVMSVFIIMKMALAGTSMTYYLSKHFKKTEVIFASIGLFYASSSYYAAFSWNLMWLDCLVMLPLITLGLERLVDEKKPFLYGASLAFAIYSNYYIAIMLCIFSVLYFIYLLVIRTRKEGAVMFLLSRTAYFGGFSLLAGGIAAAMVVPAVYGLMSTASGSFNFDWTWNNYFSISYTMYRSLINVPASIFEAHDPNVYCTVAIFLFLPLYWVSKKVDLKEKIGKTVFLAIFIISFNTNVPNYIWHGLHFPNSLPARESFIYIFLLLVVCTEAILNFKDYTNKEILTTFGIDFLIICFLEQTYKSEEGYVFTIVYLSLLFLVVYLGLLGLARKTKKFYRIVSYVAVVACFVECLINSNNTAIGTTSRVAYTADNAAIEKMVAKAKEDSDTLFYRTEKFERRSKNDAAWHGYHGMSIFSSMALKGVSDLYTDLGCEESYNAYSFYGTTPLTMSMFAVKYTISDSVRAGDDLETLFSMENYEQDGNSKNIYMYKNPYTLPIGFMVNDDFNALWDTTSTNPFAVQNSWVLAATNGTDVFQSVASTPNGSTITVPVTEDGDLYFKLINSGVDSIYVTVTNDADGSNVLSKTYYNQDPAYICHIGQVKAGQTVTVTGSSDDVENTSTINGYFYSFNHEAFINAYNQLSDEGLEVTSFKDDEIKGTIRANADGLCYTSIAYEKGWSVYVDGKKVNTVAIKDALLGFKLTAGEHKIIMNYHPEGRTLGRVITTISIAIYVVLFIIFTGFYLTLNQWRKYKEEERRIERSNRNKK